MTQPRDLTQARRAEELLVQRVTEGLNADEAAELAALGAADDLSFERTVAELDLALTRPINTPPQLLDRILASTQGGAPSGTAGAPIDPPPHSLIGSAAHPGTAGVIDIASARRRRRSEVVAWTTAALSLAAAAGALLWATGRKPLSHTDTPVAVHAAPTVQEQRLRLLKTADVQTMRWTATKDPAGQSVTGDLVWSPSQQEGYAKFAGLAVNDPSQMQYQLWIFDKNRDEKFPVDGGVFNVVAAGPSGEAIVQITPRLPIRDAALFAVTIERPGGVVVSSRDRIVVTAAPKG